MGLKDFFLRGREKRDRDQLFDAVNTQKGHDQYGIKSEVGKGVMTVPLSTPLKGRNDQQDAT